MTRRLLTGDRCTGPLHIGHYVGKLVPLLKALNEDYDAYVMIADYHALTTHYHDPAQIRHNAGEVLLDYLAAGIDPERHTVFLQSQVPEHLELAYLLGALTPVSYLERVPTYKEKVDQIGEPPNFILLGYPVLMAADILVYRGEAVPVGDDQLPHLELTREIARRFNRAYGLDLPEPQALLNTVSRLRGLDGEAKMSKSLHNQIDLGMSAEETTRRIKGMVTDPERARRGDPGRPEVCTAYQYYQAFAADEADETARECRAAGRGCVACKERLAGCINACFAPLRARRAELTATVAGRNGNLAADILAAGNVKARRTAMATMAQVREKMGM
jgi:tryptophanyl-tRNA synthetase